MLGIIVAPLALVGSATAILQVARGLTRGVGKLAAGEPGAALVECAGGLSAPFVSFANQASRLVDDVFEVVNSLTDDRDDHVRLRRSA